MIKDDINDYQNQFDNLDELISLLNSKHIDLPNKVKLKPISKEAFKKRKKRQLYDETITLEEDIPTQKTSYLTTEPEEFIKTHEKFYSTTKSNTHKLNRIRRNLVDFPPEMPDIDKTVVKPNKARKTRNKSKSKERDIRIKKKRGDKKFNIRKLKKKNKGPLNLITNTPIQTQLEGFKPARRALDDNRLARSKHILIKTFNRYMSNPTMFIKNSGGFSDLVSLNSNFDDPHLAANLFRTGTDTYARTVDERRTLIFRPFKGDLSIPVEDPEDCGYNFKTSSTVRSIIATLKDNGFNQTNSSRNWIIYWGIGSIKPDIYRGLNSHQKVNKFPKSNEITRKDKMNRNISQMVLKHGKTYDFVPKTYLLPQEISLLMRDAEKKKHGKKYYICKPNASSQGKGIYVTDDIEKILNKRITDVIVSEYISDPLLINGLKFDLRIYVVITSVNPLRFYLYEEGLARFATEKFSLSHEKMKNRYVHLTNYSVNKYNNKDGMTVDNYKWSFSALKKTMKNLGLDVNLMMMRIEDVLIKTIISIEKKMFDAFEKYVPYRNNCFQLLGFDILIDSKLNPWLIEVNLSPSLGTDSEIDRKIKTKLVSNMFTLIGVEPLGRKSSNSMNTNKKLLKYLKPLEAMMKKKRKGMSIRKKEMQLIQETREEILRAKKFKLLYPSYNVSLYKNFFEEDRPYNAILRNE